MSRIALSSPAKINLYLRVLSKRKDGYHNIVTLFEKVDLCDQIVLSSRPTNKIVITCNDPQVPVGPKNLVYRAVQLVQQDLNIDKGINISINKVIPVAAGLAGGSSNAGTVLRGLNQIWNLGLSRRKLLSYARKLGSDVPFFLYDSSWALGEERGDVIKPLKMSRKLCHVLVVPKVKLYSSQIYGGLKLKLTKKRDNVNILIHYLRKRNKFALSQLLTNDLEPETIRVHPPLAALKRRLISLGGEGVLISGSGPAVFSLTKTAAEATRLRTTLLKRYTRVFVVKTL